MKLFDLEAFRRGLRESNESAEEYAKEMERDPVAWFEKTPLSVLFIAGAFWIVLLTLVVSAIVFLIAWVIGGG